MVTCDHTKISPWPIFQIGHFGCDQHHTQNPCFDLTSLTKDAIIDPRKKGGRKMFYYNVKFTNGETLVILSDGDPVDEVPVEFQGDVIDVATICEVSA